MPSKRIDALLPDVVSERDSLIVRHYAEHLEGLGFSDGKTGTMTDTARHVAVWLAAGGRGLDRLNIRLLGNHQKLRGQATIRSIAWFEFAGLKRPGCQDWNLVLRVPSRTRVLV